MAEPYKPVPCGFYDQLEAYATLGTPCEVVFREGESSITLRGRIRDLFTREKAEYLQLEQGPEIRLDRIEKINGTSTALSC